MRILTREIKINYTNFVKLSVWYFHRVSDWKLLPSIWHHIILRFFTNISEKLSTSLLSTGYEGNM
jgi:hypothetical protein